MTHCLAIPAMSDQARPSLASTMVVHAALLLTAVSLFAGKAGAQDSGCKAVVDAAVLQARTPSHVYSSMTGPDTNLTSETITTSFLRLHEEQCKRRRSMEKDELLARGRGPSGCGQQ